MPLTQEILHAAVQALREFEFASPATADTWLKAEFEKTTAGNRSDLETALGVLKHKDDPEAAKKAAAIASVMALFTELDKKLTILKNTTDALVELDSKTALLIGVAKMENNNAIQLLKSIEAGTFSILKFQMPAPGGISHEDIRKAEKAANHLGIDKEIFRECFDEIYAEAVKKIDAAIATKFPTPPGPSAKEEQAKQAVLKFVEAAFDAREAIDSAMKSDVAYSPTSNIGDKPKILQDIEARKKMTSKPVGFDEACTKHQNTLHILENIHKGIEWEAVLPVPHPGMELESKGGRKKFFKEEFESMKKACETAHGYKVIAGDPAATADIGKNFSIKTADAKSILVDCSTEDHVKVSRSACEAAGISSTEIDDKMIALAVEGAKLKGLTEVAINSCPKELEKKLIEELGKEGIKAITDEQLTKKVKASELFRPSKEKGDNPDPTAAPKKPWYDIRPSPWK